MNQTSYQYRVLAVGALGAALVVLSVLLFLLANPFEAVNTLIFYGFMVLAYIAAILVVFVFGGNGSAKQVFYHLPIFRTAIGYVMTETLLLAAGVFLTPFLSWKLALSIQLAVTGAFVLAGLGAYGGSLRIREMDAQVASVSRNVRTMADWAYGIAARTQDAAVKKRISRLAEDLRFAVPVGTDETAAMESRLWDGLQELEDMVSRGELEEAVRQSDQLSGLLTQRNRFCRDQKPLV